MRRSKLDAEEHKRWKAARELAAKDLVEKELRKVFKLAKKLSVGIVAPTIGFVTFDQLDIMLLEDGYTDG